MPITGSTSVEVEIKVNTEKTVIDVYEPLECQIQVTEILAWLTAAVRSPTEQSLSSSEACLTSETYESDPRVAYFKLQPKPLNPIEDGLQMCWHTLFVYSFIVVQFPYAERTQGIGLELSPFVMVTMAGILTAVEFRGGLILRGLSTALIPLKETEGGDTIQWRLATANTIHDAFHPELYDGIDEYYKVQDLQQLWEKKEYLGEVDLSDNSSCTRYPLRYRGYWGRMCSAQPFLFISWISSQKGGHWLRYLNRDHS